MLSPDLVLFARNPLLCHGKCSSRIKATSSMVIVMTTPITAMTGPHDAGSFSMSRVDQK